MDEQPTCAEHQWLPFIDTCGPQCKNNGKQVGWMCGICFELDFEKPIPQGKSGS